MASEKTATRRRYGAEMKAQVLAECDAARRVGGQGGDGAWHQRQRRAPLAQAGPRGERSGGGPDQREFVPVTLRGRRRAAHDRARHRGRTAPRRSDDEDHLAGVGGGRLRRLDARAAAVIRVDAVWLAVEPLDMRAGTEAALARVVNVFGAARPHHAYLFANRRANRMKVLVHDGIGVWLAARRLNTGKFVWPKDAAATLTLTPRAARRAGARPAVAAHRRGRRHPRAVARPSAIARMCRCARASRHGTITLP